MPDLGSNDTLVGFNQRDKLSNIFLYKKNRTQFPRFITQAHEKNQSLGCSHTKYQYSGLLNVYQLTELFKLLFFF